MKTIGQIIANARSDKRYSYYTLAEITKIKSSFIEALEKEDWQSLPAFPIVLGFAKSIASALSLDEQMVVAVLKRDYPPKKLKISPNPDIPTKPSWSPRLTFALGIGITVIVIVGYLIFQFIKFTSPPKLTVASPVEGQLISGNSVLVFGTTDPDAKITVDNQPVLVGEDGRFSENIEITPGTNEITVKATTRSGKETTIIRKIEVQSNNQ